MRTLQRESNEDSYWWLDGEAPKNTSRNVGHRRRFKRSCQSLRGASQEAPVRNANLWVFVLDPNTASAFRPPAMPTNARSMTTKRLTKAKGGLCPTSLVAILKHPRQHEVQKNRQAGIPFQFLLHHPLLCFRAVYRDAAIASSCFSNAHSSNVPSSISDASVTFSQRPSSSRFQQLHCKYPKLFWAAIKKPSQLFTSGMLDR